jgi:L-fuconate dehydratase
VTTITGLETHDLRFPTSLSLDGSDAMNPDPDYSAAYVVLKTNTEGMEGHGLTFTIGRGNDICCAAIEAMRHLVVGLDLAWISQNPGRFWRYVTSDSQLRWIGPDKGVIHLATGAVVNAVWDLLAKQAGKPVWRLVADMSPEEIVDIVDFRYLTDAITRDEALEILRRAEPGKAERIARLEETGYPCYTTSAGWLGYPDDKLRRLCREAVAAGYDYVKLKVGRDLEDDIRRLRIAREELGPDRFLMIDANQVWDVGEAIDWMKELAFAETVLHRGAHQPGRYRRPQDHPRSDRAGEGRHRRDVPEPHHLQADDRRRRHRRGADRRLPHGRAQRGAGGPADGCQVRTSCMAARRRRRPLRICPTSLDD